MTVVWISHTNYHKILWSKHLRSYIKNSPQCFIRYPETSKSVLKNLAAPHFSTHFSVSGYQMKPCVSFLIYSITWKILLLICFASFSAYTAESKLLLQWVQFAGTANVRMTKYICTMNEMLTETFWRSI